MARIITLRPPREETAIGNIVRSSTGYHRAAAASALTAKTTLNLQNVKKGKREKEDA